MGQKEPANNKPKGRLLQFKQNKQSNGDCMYSDVDKDLLCNAIDEATKKGAAIMFGLTGDGGAFSVMILDGNDKAREYPHGAVEMNDLLRTIVATYTD